MRDVSEMWRCCFCDKAFSRKWLLRGHERTHTGEKPFVCSTCQRAFVDQSNLHAHMQTHMEVKRFQCPYCSASFSRRNLLMRHSTPLLTAAAYHALTTTIITSSNTACDVGTVDPTQFN
ncbi:unnamed protein product [Hydatigera taeniaeformis]|uniref:Zinc finger, C2H2 type n=1 Tax=Hydatigena taeniaeformis TaxID=6205 RepID=A0A0R3XDH2_HYDTA|nr:unnamed protein product [Hydatigera taeniaeformis]